MKADNTKVTQPLSEQEIASHKALIGFNDQDAKQLSDHAELVASQLDRLIDEFYTQQMAIPEVSAVISVDERLSRLKSVMKQYILDLFSGNYDSDYVMRRLEIGRVHESLGVSAKLYLSAAYQLEALLRETIPDKNSPAGARLLDALRKVMQFDLQLVIGNFIENLMHKVRIAQEELEDYAESLEEVVTERTRQLHELSRKDELTELVNRDGMVENLRRELANAMRYKETISFVCFTLNGYRQLVRKKGQAIGNVVLNRIGHDIKSQVREADIACRGADDEFCIIMPRTHTNEAMAICQRLIDMFRQDNEYDLSFSMGVATSDTDQVSEADVFLRIAEDRMRKAVQETGFVISVE